MTIAASGFGEVDSRYLPTTPFGHSHGVQVQYGRGGVVESQLNFIPKDYELIPDFQQVQWNTVGGSNAENGGEEKIVNAQAKNAVEGKQYSDVKEQNQNKTGNEKNQNATNKNQKRKTRRKKKKKKKKAHK